MQKYRKINSKTIKIFKKNRVNFERGWILIGYILIVYRNYNTS